MLIFFFSFNLCTDKPIQRLLDRILHSKEWISIRIEEFVPLRIDNIEFDHMSSFTISAVNKLEVPIATEDIDILIFPQFVGKFPDKPPRNIGKSNRNHRNPPKVVGMLRNVTFPSFFLFLYEKKDYSKSLFRLLFIFKAVVSA